MHIQKLIDFLQANHQNERYLLGTSSTLLAAPIIVETREAVMAMGGFHGLDPVLTPEQLAQMVEAKQIRFVMVGDLSSISRRLGAEEAGRPITNWVRAHGTIVDPALWRTRSLDAGPSDDDNPNQALNPANPDAPRRPSRRGPRSPVSRMQLYDLRPEAGVVPAPAP
jgi:hypothetical protein